MRYTLRLLTAQQFQRAAALICACEMLRRERIARRRPAVGPHPVPHRVVGRRLGHAQHLRGGPPGSRGQPWGRMKRSAGRCSSPPARGAGRGCPRGVTCAPTTNAGGCCCYCSDPEGDCAFTRRRSPDEGLPVLTVDEEIYRLTPALVIGTVDKFAQLPWKAATAHPVRDRRPRAAPGTAGGARTPRWCSRPPPAQRDAAGGHPAAGDAAAAAGPDHPGRAAPDQRRARVDGRAVRDDDRPAVHPGPGRAGGPARARRLHRNGAPGPRPGRAGLRPRPDRLPAAGARRRRDVLLHRVPPSPETPGRRYRGHLRDRGAAEGGRDPGHRRGAGARPVPSRPARRRPPTHT